MSKTRAETATNGQGPDNQTLLRLLEQGEKLHSMFRCARVQGLDIMERLLLFGKDHFYVVDGFTLLKTREIRDLNFLPEQIHDPIIPYIAAMGYRHCNKFAYDDIKEVHKRYLLQQISLEVFSTDGRNFLLAFPRKVRDHVFQKLVSMTKNASSDMAQFMNEQKKLRRAEMREHLFLRQQRIQQHHHSFRLAKSPVPIASSSMDSTLSTASTAHSSTINRQTSQQQQQPTTPTQKTNSNNDDQAEEQRHRQKWPNGMEKTKWRREFRLKRILSEYTAFLVVNSQPAPITAIRKTLEAKMEELRKIREQEVAAHQTEKIEWQREREQMGGRAHKMNGAASHGQGVDYKQIADNALRAAEELQKQYREYQRHYTAEVQRLSGQLVKLEQELATRQQKITVVAPTETVAEHKQDGHNDAVNVSAVIKMPTQHQAQHVTRPQRGYESPSMSSLTENNFTDNTTWDSRLLDCGSMLTRSISPLKGQSAMFRGGSTVPMLQCRAVDIHTSSPLAGLGQRAIAVMDDGDFGSVDDVQQKYRRTGSAGTNILYRIRREELAQGKHPTVPNGENGMAKGERTNGRKGAQNGQ